MLICHRYNVFRKSYLKKYYIVKPSMYKFVAHLKSSIHKCSRLVHYTVYCLARKVSYKLQPKAVWQRPSHHVTLRMRHQIFGRSNFVAT